MEKTLNREYLRAIPNYDQMRLLDKALNDANIPHEYKIDVHEMGPIHEEWHDIKIPSSKSFWGDKEGFSVILNGGSFGHSEGLLEVWKRPGMDGPAGWFTADDVMKMIREVF